MRLLDTSSIGKMVLKNRVVMCPLGFGGLVDPDGGFSKRAKEYYVERAKGGVGLITTAMTTVTAKLEPHIFIPAWLDPVLDDRSKVSRLSEVADELHQYGTKLCVQLTPGLGRLAWPERGSQLVSASSVPAWSDPSLICRELTREEIEMLVDAFGYAASLAEMAGVDTIEIHGYGGYLIDQFQSAVWNKRTDDYGGDLDGRLKFSMQLIEAVESNCQAGFPIIYKFTPVQNMEGGRRLDEGLEMARRFQDAGVAALHVDVGTYEEWYRVIPPVYQPDANQIAVAESVKKAVDIPVIAHGKLGRPEVAEASLKEKKIDFVGLGRPLLADPYWVNKVKGGRIDDIRPCIGCNCCLVRILRGKYISCAVNPECGKEEQYRPNPAAKTKSVLVVGGGPGGMEAAIVAASRGHEVTLWEKSSQLGGTMLPGTVPDFKQDVVRYKDYLITQVKKQGISLRLMMKATLENVLQMSPEVVIIATGGEPIVPDLPGITEENVVTAVDALLGNKSIKDKVVVVGGGFVGCETAVFLAEQGKRVTVIEMEDRLLPDPSLAIMNRMNLEKMVKDCSIGVIVNTELQRIENKEIVVIQDGNTKTIACDTVVLALGFAPRLDLKNAVDGKIAQVFAVGDCSNPGLILDAVWEAFHVARNI